MGEFFLEVGMSTINENAVVEIDYILKNDQGEVVDSSEEAGPLVLYYG